MNRRHFISTSMAAMSATALPGTAFAEIAKPKRDIKIALKYSMITGGANVMEKFKIAQEAGYAGVEPNGPLEEKVLEEMIAACAETKLVIPGLVCPGGGREMGSLDAATRKKGVAVFEKTLQQSKQLGGTTVLMYPGNVDKDNPYHLVFNALIESTREAVPMARETGVKIALENVWNNIFLSPLDVIQFVDTINSPLVGWFFDIGNVARYGWPEQWVQALGKRIFKLDIKGYSTSKHMKEGPWAGFKVEIGEDEINYAAVMKALDEVGYSGGWISAEVGGGDLARLTKVREQIAKILAL